MLNENAKLWVEDLRKNGNLQGRGALHKEVMGEDKFCCLGRACILYNLNNQDNQLSIKFNEITGMYAYSNNIGTLPTRVRDWLGLRSQKGIFDDNCLTHLNDSGKTFAEIADIIESEPEGLFV